MLDRKRQGKAARCLGSRRERHPSQARLLGAPESQSGNVNPVDWIRRHTRYDPQGQSTTSPSVRSPPHPTPPHPTCCSFRCGSWRLHACWPPPALILSAFTSVGVRTRYSRVLHQWLCSTPPPHSSCNPSPVTLRSGSLSTIPVNYTRQLYPFY